MASQESVNSGLYAGECNLKRWCTTGVASGVLESDEELKRLPPRARYVFDTMYKSVYSAYKEGSMGKTTPDSVARRAAWDALRREFEQDQRGVWRPKKRETKEFSAGRERE